MIEFTTRSQKHSERIEAFLDSQEESIEMILYKSEIHTLTKRYPNVTIQQGERYSKGSDLFRCKVEKAKPV